MRVRRASMDTVIPNTPSMHKDSNHENGHLTQRRITDTKPLEQGKTNGRRSSGSSSFKYHTEPSDSPENIDEIIRQKEHILKGLSGLSIDHMSRKPSQLHSPFLTFSTGPFVARCQKRIYLTIVSF